MISPFVRSLYTEEVNHFPAVIEMITGHRGRQFNHPCLGSWVSYALGTANKNLPAFINIGRPSSPVQLTGGYLGTTESATPFGIGEVPVEHLNDSQVDLRRSTGKRSGGAYSVLTTSFANTTRPRRKLPPG